MGDDPNPPPVRACDEVSIWSPGTWFTCLWEKIVNGFKSYWSAIQHCWRLLTWTSTTGEFSWNVFSWDWSKMWNYQTPDSGWHTCRYVMFSAALIFGMMLAVFGVLAYFVGQPLEQGAGVVADLAGSGLNAAVGAASYVQQGGQILLKYLNFLFGWWFSFWAWVSRVTGAATGLTKAVAGTSLAWGFLMTLTEIEKFIPDFFGSSVYSVFKVINYPLNAIDQWVRKNAGAILADLIYVVASPVVVVELIISLIVGGTWAALKQLWGAIRVAYCNNYTCRTPPDNNGGPNPYH